MGERSPQVREQELLEERTKLIADWIRSDPSLVQEIEEGFKAAEQGQGVLAKEHVKKRGGRAV